MNMHKSLKAASTPVSDLLFVDPQVENSEILLAGLEPSIDVVRLKSGSDPFDQIAAAVSASGNIDTVHILSHGEPGALALAGQKIDENSLRQNPSALCAIRSSLAGGAKLALWACSTAAGAIGKSFIGALEAATGAEVFASDTPVGDAAKGGRWYIGTTTPFSAHALAAYPHTLPTFDFTGGSGHGTATYTETESGVTMTVVDDSGDTINIFNAGTAAGLSGDAIAFGGTGSLTVTFDQGVTITSFRYAEDDGTIVGTDSVIFTPIGGTGSPSTITKLPGDFANGGFDITPADWVGVTGFTVTYTGGTPIDPILDTIVFNDAPTVSGEPTDLVFTEDTAGDVDLSTVTVADSDGDSLTVTLSIDAGSFSTPADGSGVGAGVTETLVNATTITLAGTAADINTYLDTALNIQYTGASNVNGDDVATLTITPNDGTEDGTAATVNIDIAAVNDAPTITGLATDIVFTEDVAGNLDLSASAFADVDSAGNVTVTLTASEGTFSTPADGSAVGAGVTETLVNATTVTLVGTVDDINTYLNTASNVQYTGATNDNGDDTSTVTVTINDGDGSGDVAAGTINIDTVAVNDAPTVSGMATDIVFTEDVAGNLDLSASAFADVDSAGNVTVTLTASEGTFSTPADGSAVGAGVTETLVNATTVTLVGTVDDINTYLNTASNVQYTGATNDNGDDTSTVTVSINDGDGSGDVAAGTINIDTVAVNDAPTVSGMATDIVFTEDTAGNLDLSASAFADVDSAGNVTVTLTASEGTFSTPADGSAVGAGVTETLVNATTVTLVGTVADINTYLNTASNVQYTGATDDNGDDTSTVTVTINDGDGSGDVAAGTVNIDITAVNDAPTGSNATVNMNEDTSYTLTAANFGFGDVDTGDAMVSVRIDTLTLGSGTFQLSGADLLASDVISVGDINAGNLVYTPAADANGAGLLTFTFSVNDGTSFAASSSTLTIDVAAVAEPVDDPVNIVGTASDEALNGGSGDDTLIGGAGDDIVSGGAGDDVIYAGPGDDGNDTVDGGSGNDIIGGAVGDDFIEGGDGNDTLFGGSGNDTIFATNQNNENGDTSSNTIWAGSGADAVTGGLGADTLGGGTGGDNVEGGGGNDTLFGGAGDDTMNGGTGADLLFGGAGSDTVLGGTGNDTLWAGAGDDSLTGGEGADTFVFGATSGNDTITDFNISEDILDFSFSGLADLAAIQAAASNANQGGSDGLLIDLGDGESVFLAGLGLADLSSVSLAL